MLTSPPVINAGVHPVSNWKPKPLMPYQEIPICAMHNVPMVWQKGRKGFFWSCHERNADGSFCSYRPNGH